MNNFGYWRQVVQDETEINIEKCSMNTYIFSIWSRTEKFLDMGLLIYERQHTDPIG